jgi:putative phosphoribosyl transferase
VATTLIHEVQIPIADGAFIAASQDLAAQPRGLVLFAHGSGSSRMSTRNQFVAQVLQEAGFGTFLFDLLTVQEDALDQQTAELRFDIDLLADRLVTATHWVRQQAGLESVPLGCFGASTGAAAALVAAAALPTTVAAIVSRGGRPDLAGVHLRAVRAPTLLIVGGADTQIITLNRRAMECSGSKTNSSLFPEPRISSRNPARSRQLPDSLVTGSFVNSLQAKADYRRNGDRLCGC